MISNQDVQALRALDLWLENIDTLEVLPNFPEQKHDYKLPTIKDIDWGQQNTFIRQIVRDRSFHLISEASSVQIVALLQFCWKYTLNDIVSEVYGRLLVPVGDPARVPCSPETVTDLVEFLHFRPTAAIYFARVVPWSQHPLPLTQAIQSCALDILYALVASANTMEEMVVTHLCAILREAVALTLVGLKRLLETVCLVVRNPELLLTIFMECQVALRAAITDHSAESIEYFLKGMFGIMLDHCDEANENHETSKEVWALKPREGAARKATVITARRRIDAPRLARLAVGDHVRFVASNEPVNSTTTASTSFDVLVEKVADTEVEFRCLCQPPVFLEEVSWRMKHCGPFVTSTTMAEAMVKLLSEREECCPIYKSLLPLGKGWREAAATTAEALEESNIEGLNRSQNRAVAMSLSRQLSCLWGPPGTGKTTTIVALLRMLLLQDSQRRVLVTAPTHNAVDNVLRQYVKRALGTDPSLPKPVRVSTEVGVKVLCVVSLLTMPNSCRRSLTIQSFILATPCSVKTSGRITERRNRHASASKNPGWYSRLVWVQLWDCCRRNPSTLSLLTKPPNKPSPRRLFH